MPFFIYIRITFGGVGRLAHGAVATGAFFANTARTPITAGTGKSIRRFIVVLTV